MTIRSALTSLIDPHRQSLLRAVQQGNLQQVRAILKHFRANPNAKYLSSDGGQQQDARMRQQTAMIRGIRLGQHNIVKALMASGADINKPDARGRTPLMIAVERSDPIMVRLLLDHPKIRVNQTDKQGNTALMVAAHLLVDPVIVDYLLDKHANPNLVNKDGDTALILSVYPDYANANNQNRVVEKLLQAGANYNLENKKTLLTPLMIAVAYENRPIIQTLIKYGADPSYAPSVKRMTAKQEARINAQRRRILGQLQIPIGKTPFDLQEDPNILRLFSQFMLSTPQKVRRLKQQQQRRRRPSQPINTGQSSPVEGQFFSISLTPPPYGSSRIPPN